MKQVKRLEIVVDAFFGPEVTALLARHSLDGWTIVRGASGRGERGTRLADDITGVSNNHLILTTCPPERLDALLTDLRVLLTRYGGSCLVSDASWLKH